MTIKEIEYKINTCENAEMARKLRSEIVKEITARHYEEIYARNFDQNRAKKAREEISFLYKCKKACEQMANIKVVPHYCHW